MSQIENCLLVYKEDVHKIVLKLSVFSRDYGSYMYCT